MAQKVPSKFVGSNSCYGKLQAFLRVTISTSEKSQAILRQIFYKVDGSKINRIGTEQKQMLLSDVTLSLSKGYDKGLRQVQPDIG